MSYTPEQRTALACVLDEIIPPSEDGRLPGAGEIGLAEHLEQNVTELEPFVVQGLAALDELAAGRGAASGSSFRSPLTPTRSGTAPSAMKRSRSPAVRAPMAARRRNAGRTMGASLR